MTSDTHKLNNAINKFLQQVGLTDLRGQRHESTHNVFQHGQNQRQQRQDAMSTSQTSAAEAPTFVAQDLTRAQRWGAKMACEHILSTDSGALRGAIMAHSMGLGKTLIGVEVSRAFLHHYRAQPRVVVVAAPSTLCEQWQEELENKKTFGAYCLFANNVRACRVTFALPAGVSLENVQAEIQQLAPGCTVGTQGVQGVSLCHVRGVARKLRGLQCTDVWAHLTPAAGPGATEDTVVSPDKMFAGLRITQGSDVEGHTADLADYDYLVISHALFSNTHKSVAKALKQKHAQALLVLDEAQRAKNKDKNKDKGLNQAALSFGGKRLLLTATPMEINIDELWNLASLLLPDNLDNAVGLAADLGRALENGTEKAPLLQVSKLMQDYQKTEGKTDDTTAKYLKVIDYVNTCMYSFMDRLGPSVLSDELQRKTRDIERSEFMVKCCLDDAVSTNGRTLGSYVTPSKSRDDFLVRYVTRRQRQVELGTARKTIIFLWYKDYLQHVMQLLENVENGCGMQMLAALDKATVVDSYSDKDPEQDNDGDSELDNDGEPEQYTTDRATDLHMAANDDTRQRATANDATSQRATAGGTYAVLHGSMSPQQRREAIAAFKNEGSCTVLVANIKVGGVGLNLQNTADAVVFVNSDWNPANMEQAAGRIWRRGQTRSCSIVHLVVAYEGTFQKHNQTRTPTTISNEHRVFDTMIKRVVASANFLDGKYLIGDDSDLFDATPEAVAPLDAYRAHGVTINRIKYNMKNVVNVSVDTPAETHLRHYKVKKGGTQLPIYDDQSQYTAAFAGLAERIRAKLLQDVYYCPARDVFFFQDEISLAPPLLYPLTLEQLQRVQRKQPIPPAYRMAFGWDLTPALKQDMQAAAGTYTGTYAQRNRELSTAGHPGGVVCLCTAPAAPPHQSPGLLVCLLQLLLHTGNAILPKTPLKNVKWPDELKVYIQTLRDAQHEAPVRAYPLLKLIAECRSESDEETCTSAVQAAKRLVRVLQLGQLVCVAASAEHVTSKQRYVLWCSPANPGAEEGMQSRTKFEPYVYDSPHGPRVHVDGWILGDSVAERGAPDPEAEKVYTLWDNWNYTRVQGQRKPAATANNIKVTAVDYDDRSTTLDLSLSHKARQQEAKDELVAKLSEQRKDTNFAVTIVTATGEPANPNMSMGVQKLLENGQLLYKLHVHRVAWVPVDGQKPAQTPTQTEFDPQAHVESVKGHLKDKYPRFQFELFKDPAGRERAPSKNKLNTAFVTRDGYLQIYYTAVAQVGLHLTTSAAEEQSAVVQVLQRKRLDATASGSGGVDVSVPKGWTVQDLQNLLQRPNLKARLTKANAHGSETMHDADALQEGDTFNVQWLAPDRQQGELTVTWVAVPSEQSAEPPQGALPSTLPGDKKISAVYTQWHAEYGGYRWRLYTDGSGQHEAPKDRKISTVYTPANNTVTIYYACVKLVAVTVMEDEAPEGSTPSAICLQARLENSKITTPVPGKTDAVYMQSGLKIKDLVGALLQKKATEDAVVEAVREDPEREIKDGDTVTVAMRVREKIYFTVVNEADGAPVEGIPEETRFKDEVNNDTFRNVKNGIRKKFEKSHKGQDLHFGASAEPIQLRTLFDQGTTRFYLQATVRDRPKTPPLHLPMDAMLY